MRKAEKASRGEYVGEPIPPGFIIPVSGRKADGQYEFGIMRCYPPHAEVDSEILKELVINQQGNVLKTVQTLASLRFAFFPPELAYMETRSSLRRCPKTSTGYAITPALVKGLASNVKLIGIYKWGNTLRLNNHEQAVPQDLFLSAFELISRPLKPRGKTVHFEPLEWAGLLWCTNSPEPRLISSHNAESRYVCDRDYQRGTGPICLDCAAHFLDSPLTAVVLKQLDFTPFADQVLTKLETEVAHDKMEALQRRRKEVALEQSIRRWESLLPCCVDTKTKHVDRQKEQFYWSKIRAEQSQLEEMRTRPVRKKSVADTQYSRVRSFLENMPSHWQNFPRTTRNRLLKLIIEKVELHHDGERIDATIVWKTGLRQRILIHRPAATSGREKRWSAEENNVLKMLYPSAAIGILLSAFPRRSYSAISSRASRLRLQRHRQYHPPPKWRPWTNQEDAVLKASYQAGDHLSDIARQLSRTVDAIETRATAKRLSRPSSAKWKRAEATWELHDLHHRQKVCSGK
jgi:hypothetical protein